VKSILHKLIQVNVPNNKEEQNTQLVVFSSWQKLYPLPRTQLLPFALSGNHHSEGGREGGKRVYVSVYSLDCSCLGHISSSILIHQTDKETQRKVRGEWVGDVYNETLTGYTTKSLSLKIAFHTQIM
jgi:hypothetical protein